MRRSTLPTPSRLRRFFLAVLLLWTNGVAASEVDVPLKLDYQFLRRILLEQVYTDPGETARVLDDPAECSTLVLSDPRIGKDSGRIRIVTAAEAHYGSRIAGDCWHLPMWRGFIEVFQEAVLVPGQPKVEFRVVDSNLLDEEGEKPLVSGILWDWVKQYVHPRMARFTVDLDPPVLEVRALVPLMLSPTGLDAAHRSLQSAEFSTLEILDAGIVLTLNFSLAGLPLPPAAPSAEPALTAEETQRWEAAWQRWDAFLTFVVKQAAGDTEEAQLRAALLEVLLDGRYDLTEALITWKAGTPDPVRGLFLKSWNRLSPILQRMETTLPGTEAVRYLSFVTAADALKALDQIGEKVGYEISADGLRRLARMLDPKLEEDPLTYRLDVDPELRRLFGFGAPLPLLKRLPDTDGGAWYFIGSAWAADDPDGMLVGKLNGWAPDRSDLDTYLPLVAELLDLTANETVQSKGLTAEYHGFFRRLSLATAWQESCWRQFVKKGGLVQPLTSPAGAIGIMQVNPHVWRGFYQIPALRSDIAYNASAGTEILHHYLSDYVFATSEHKRKENFDRLARLTYVAYNGGPSYLRRYRKRSAPKAVERVAMDFSRKYLALETSGPPAVASCY